MEQGGECWLSPATVVLHRRLDAHGAKGTLLTFFLSQFLLLLLYIFFLALLHIFELLQQFMVSQDFFISSIVKS